MEKEIEVEKKQQLCPLPLFNHVRPLIVVTHTSDKSTRHSSYSLSEKSSYDLIIPELDSKIVRDGGCGDGWIYLEANDDNSDVCLLNILTMEKVQLPPLLTENGKKYSREWAFFIFSPPTNPRCRIIMYERIVATVISCSPGDKSFTRHGEIGLAGVFTNFTMSGGKIYCLTPLPFTLVVCDTLDEPSNFREVGMLEDDDLLGSWRCFLVESCGQILLVQARAEYYDTSCLETLNFRIYLADFSKLEWIRLKSLGKRAIFLQDTKGFSCSTSELQGVKDDCIYFLFDHNDRKRNMYQTKEDRNVYVFDLEDQSISSFLPCPDDVHDQLKEDRSAYGFDSEDQSTPSFVPRSKVKDRRQLLRWMMLPISS